MADHVAPHLRACRSTDGLVVVVCGVVALVLATAHAHKLDDFALHACRVQRLQIHLAFRCQRQLVLFLCLAAGTGTRPSACTRCRRTCTGRRGCCGSGGCCGGGPTFLGLLGALASCLHSVVGSNETPHDSRGIPGKPAKRKAAGGGRRQHTG